MSDTLEPSVPYRVSYTEHVRNGLRKLGAIARQRGLGRQFVAALLAIDSRLKVYPQFGQPLCDLKLRPTQLWIGVVPPLVVHYILNEEQRLVMVVSPMMPLPHSGF